jgi:hypothetical protein
MSGYTGDVYSLSEYNSELIAGGLFTAAGGVSANNIAKWNGTSWSALGSGMGGTSNPIVRALTVYNNGLRPESFTAGGVTGKLIARWGSVRDF